MSPVSFLQTVFHIPPNAHDYPVFVSQATWSAGFLDNKLCQESRISLIAHGCLILSIFYWQPTPDLNITFLLHPVA